MKKAKSTKQTSVAPTTATSCQLTGSDIDSMSFNDLDSLIKAGTDRIVLNRTEAKKIRETLAPVIVRAYELLSKNQGARTDLDPSLPTVEKWMEQNKDLGSPSTFYRLLAKAKVIPPQIGDAYTTPDGNIAKISHLHVTDPNKVDVEEMFPGTDQPVVKTYNLDDLKPIKLMPVYCAKTPDGWDVDVAMSGAHKSMRRGDEANGVYWIKQLYFANAEGRCHINVWKRPFVYACEDIGLADLSVKTRVLDLYKNLKQHLKELEEIAEICKDGARHSDLLMVVEAMMLCCRAKKSRAVDDAITYFNEHPTYRPPTEDEIKLAVQTKQPKPVVTDDGPIYDMHTKRGRDVLGRKRGTKVGEEHFKNVAAHLENKSAVADFQAPTTVVNPAKPFHTESGL
jgi:hypothetical protein